MKAGVPATLLESRELGEETNWLGDNERPKTTFIVEFPLPSGKRSKVSDSLDNWKRFASGTLACGSVVVLFWGVRAPEDKTPEFSSGRAIDGGDKLLPNKSNGNIKLGESALEMNYKQGDGHGSIRGWPKPQFQIKITTSS